jgi:signal transduction histidine kinase
LPEGHGVPAENIDQIFDPFFATKEVGKGTSLGLSVSHSIVEEHQGQLSYERGDPWARFVILLPIEA